MNYPFGDAQKGGRKQTTIRSLDPVYPSYFFLFFCILPKYNSVISFSKSFLMNVLYHIFKRGKEEEPHSLARHSGSTQPSNNYLSVSSNLAPYTVGILVCLPSFGHAQDLPRCCCSFPQGQNVFLILQIQFIYHFLFLLFVRTE